MPNGYGRETLNMTGGLIAVGLTMALWFLLYALVYVKVPDENQNALLIVIGILSTNITSIVAFYFGSSLGAKKQSETIDTLANTANTAANTAATVAGTRPGTVELQPGQNVKVEGVDEKH